MAKIRVKPPFGGFWAKKGPFGPSGTGPRQGFYINPSRPGGLGRPRGLKGPRRALRDQEGPESRIPGSPDPRSSRIPGRGPPAPGREGSPDPGFRDPGAPRGWFYINPSRRGPAVPAGSLRDPGSPGGPPGPPGGPGPDPLPGRGTPPARARGFTSTPRAGAPRFPAGVGAPEGGLEGSPLLLPEEGSSVPRRCPGQARRRSTREFTRTTGAPD